MPNQGTNDAELSRLCRQGDAAAWRELLRRFSPMVYRLSVRMVGSGGQADDACQDTFLRVHRSIANFDPTRPLKPWIARIAHNVCLRMLERPGVQVPEPGWEASAPAIESGPEDHAARSEASELLVDALDTLSAQDRALVVMRYREGLSIAEASEVSGLPVNTVKTRLHRARAALRKLLAPALKDD